MHDRVTVTETQDRFDVAGVTAGQTAHLPRVVLGQSACQRQRHRRFDDGDFDDIAAREFAVDADDAAGQQRLSAAQRTRGAGIDADRGARTRRMPQPVLARSEPCLRRCE